MSTLTCPNCGNTLSVDDAHYTALVEQVRTAEFQADLEKHIELMKRQQEAEREAARLALEQNFEREKAAKDQEIARLQEQTKQIESLQKQAREAELAKRDAEIQRLQLLLGQTEQQQRTAVLEAEQRKQDELESKVRELLTLQGKLEQAEEKQRSAVLEKENEMRQTIQQKELELAELRTQTSEQEKAREEKHRNEVNFLQEEIARYRDMKARLSTKMVGETLEIHCSTEFEKMRAFRPSISFEKDNDASEGTKGDFILRDYEDGVEYLSIMFEMKNELDTTDSKMRHRNEDFFKKLDSDRTKKGCEFAVLVTLLEPESEYYNAGIVDVSHRYPNMFVIRPQFFLPMISLLMKVAKSRLESRLQLEELRRQSVDVTNFEENLAAFQKGFSMNYTRASDKFQSAVAEIDKAIRNLEKIKESLLGSENNLRLANDKAQKLSIRSLTKNAPSVREKFEQVREAKKRAAAETLPEGEVEEIN